MSQHRFFIKREFIRGEEALLKDKDEIKRLSRVLRFKEGDRVILFDGKGHEYAALISQINRHEVVFQIQKASSLSLRESPLQIILGLGVLKGSKLDLVVQKATELGVAEIKPFYTKRTVPTWEETKIISKKDRWEKIASAAAKQCQRTKIPLIHPPCSFQEALQMSIEEALRIFIWEKEEKFSFPQISTIPSSKIYALVGPEGGFSEEEAAQAQEAGFRPIHLGPRVLRSETAGLVVVTLLQFLFGDLRNK